MSALLLALLIKENWARYGDVTRAQLRTDETKEIYRAIEVLHEQTDADLTVDGLLLGLPTCYPIKKAEQLQAVVSVWKEPDPKLVAAYFTDAVQKARAYEIADKAIQCFEGRLSYEDFQSCLSSDAVEATPEYEFVSHNLSALLERQESKGGFKWRLNALNKLLGHLPRKTFGFIFARPDTGKTGLLASEITNFLLQTTENVLWVANEEDPDVVKTRCFQALYGVNEARLYSNKAEYQADYEKRVGNRLMITGDPNVNTKGGLERAIKRYKPAIVVVDQLDHLKGWKAEREDTRLGQIYHWFRSQAIAYDFAGIGVTQANSQADGTKYLRMTMIANGQTDKPAAADWILGIGKVYDNEASRFLHTPKDKLPLSEGKDPKKRHGYAEVQFDQESGRYVDYS